MKLKIKDREVEVTTERGVNGNHLKLIAECEGVVVEHEMTFGPVDIPIPDGYGEAELQKDLDVARQRVAAMAESRARIKKMLEGVS